MATGGELNSMRERKKTKESEQTIQVLCPHYYSYYSLNVLRVAIRVHVPNLCHVNS